MRRVLQVQVERLERSASTDVAFLSLHVKLKSVAAYVTVCIVGVVTKLCSESCPWEEVEIAQRSRRD